MIVTVTQEDIDSGVANSCGKCPVALALQRLFPGKEISVDYRTTFIGDRYNGGDSYQNEREARHFLGEYDGGRPVFPTSVTLLPFNPLLINEPIKENTCV